MDQMHKPTMIPEIPLIPPYNNNSNLIKNQNMNNQIVLPLELALSYSNCIYNKLIYSI